MPDDADQKPGSPDPLFCRGAVSTRLYPAVYMDLQGILEAREVLPAALAQRLSVPLEIAGYPIAWDVVEITEFCHEERVRFKLRERCGPGRPESGAALAALEAWNQARQIGLGDQVQKVSGYKWPGVVVAVFQTRAGETRYVVECTVPEVEGALHIYSRAQIEPIGILGEQGS